MLRDPSETVRLNGLAGLEAIPPGQLNGLTPQIAACAADRRVRVRDRAIGLLLRIPSRSEQRITDLRRALLDPDPELAGRVARLLPNRPGVAVAVVTPQLKSASPGNRLLAIRVLDGTGSPESAKLLGAVLPTLQDRRARLAVLTALRRHGAVAADQAPAVTRLLEAPMTEPEAVEAYRVLASAGSTVPAVRKALLAGLVSPSPRVQEASLEAVQSLKPSGADFRSTFAARMKALPAFLAQRGRVTLEELKAAPLAAPEESKVTLDPEVLALIEKLGAKDQLIQFDALNRLVSYGDRAVPALVAMIPSLPRSQRDLCLGALDRLRQMSVAALKHVITLLESPSPRIRVKAGLIAIGVIRSHGAK